MRAIFLFIFISTNALASPVVIFDLDDTLFYSSSRTEVIFKEMAEQVEFKRLYPKEIKLLTQIKQSEIEYSIEDTLVGASITNKEFIKTALEFWKARFFTNSYVKEDSLIEGAKAYVHMLIGLGVKIVYLTGRDHSMRSGTIESLISSGLPYDGKTAILITKENFATPDVEYKKGAFKDIELLGTVVAVFENEPKNLNAMIEYFPEAIAFFLDIKHSSTMVKPSSKAIRIKNYLSDILTKVTQKYLLGYHLGL